MAHATEITATPGGQEVLITRAVDAPREKVWRAYTEPELAKQWLGPRKYVTTIDKWDMKPGGSYRYIQQDEQGNEYAFHGVVHGVYKPSKVVQTFEFEGLPEEGHVALDTVMLEEQDGKTKITSISVFQTTEDRDGMIQSGMEKGVREGYERLDELLETL